MTRDLFRERVNAFEETMRAKPAGEDGFPSTYQPVSRGPGVRQSGVFEPALKQFRHAYAAGEPVFDDEVTGARWRSARHTAMHTVLDALAGSPCGNHLVLRGSVLLRTWLGDAAREPGDLDFVVTPSTLTLPDAGGLFDGIVAAVRRAPQDPDGVVVNADGVAAEDIWTYERAPGRRLVLPWRAPDLPPGTVQLDLVLNEELPEPAHLTEVRLGDQAVHVRAVSPQLSLAWKLLWLETDMWPQGKDLYDATLLAEHTTVPWGLVTSVLTKELGAEAAEFTPAKVREWDVDWDNLHDLVPNVPGSGKEWLARLEAALRRSYPG
ncbi:nucleotidyl transferase AbiEii/AbiGii toxin family protein [Micromonospora sp. IBSANI012]|uniref:nucleotidyl transferase AbiEii/AbiGii toxin family protein n=1 Tax=Micromonospora sp. IBSANI012 TaxID=3457761 RepID=UPI004059844A